MIEWRDVSDAGGERYTCELGAVDLDLARERNIEPAIEYPTRWMVMVRWRLARSHEHRSGWIDATCDADRAKLHALAFAKPLVDALAARAAEVARDLAVAVAGARLDGVG